MWKNKILNSIIVQIIHIAPFVFFFVYFHFSCESVNVLFRIKSEQYGKYRVKQRLYAHFLCPPLACLVQEAEIFAHMSYPRANYAFIV